MAHGRMLPRPMRTINFIYHEQVRYERREAAPFTSTTTIRGWHFLGETISRAWTPDATRREETLYRCPLCGRPGHYESAWVDFWYHGVGVVGFDVPICSEQGVGCLVRLNLGGDGLLGIPAAALQSIFIPHDSIRLHQIVQQDPKFFLRVMSYLRAEETFESYDGIWGDLWISKYVMGITAPWISRAQQLEPKFMTDKLIRLLGGRNARDCLICGRQGMNFVTVENELRPTWMTSGICNTPDIGCLHKMANLDLSPIEIIAGAIFYIFAPWKFTEQLTLVCPLFFIKLAEFLAVYDGNLFEVPLNPRLVNDWDQAFRDLRMRQGCSDKLPPLGSSWYNCYVDRYYNNHPRVPRRFKRVVGLPDGSNLRLIAVSDSYFDDVVVVEQTNRFQRQTESETSSSSSSS